MDHICCISISGCGHRARKRRISLDPNTTGLSPRVAPLPQKCEWDHVSQEEALTLLSWRRYMGWGKGDWRVGQRRKGKGKPSYCKQALTKVLARNKAFKPCHLKPVTPQVAGSPPGRLRRGLGAGTDRWDTAEGNRRLCARILGMPTPGMEILCLARVHAGKHVTVCLWPRWWRKEGRMPPPRASPDISFAKQRQVPADRQALRTAPSARQCNQAVQHHRASFGWSPTATWRFSSRWLCVSPSFGLWLVFGAWQSRPFGETKKWKLSPWERRRKFHLPSQIVKSHAFTPNLCLDRVVSSVLETRNIEDSKRQVQVQTGE